MTAQHKSSKAETVTIYTDGACRGNPGPGGWGVILSRGKQYKELYGGESATTNNRMELTAAIKALQALKRPLPVTLYTDSKYLILGITQWLPKWKAKGWRKSDGKPVENIDLWKMLDELASAHDVQWSWVKGHNGDPGNERADALANLGIEAINEY
ncbi:ribonuclease HI [Chromobacterium violaceum]|uniref:ribonuclease HI n=1 Tax=Chromobacterium violaceum TaxID=536 RepID=UPI003DA84C5A